MRALPKLTAGLVLHGTILASVLSFAQGPEIEHKPLSCLVAEKFPKVEACFTPRSQVAQARVYFRAGATKDWYFVEMKADAHCFLALLPKPKRILHTIDYYVAVTDKAFVEARTPEYAPDVVPDEKACRKDGLVAPFVSSGSVAVGSAAGAAAVPAGFLGTGIAGAGISTGLVVGVVGGGAAVAGGVAAVTGGGNGDGGQGSTGSTTTLAGPTTTTLAGPTTTTLAAPTTTTTTSTTLPGATTTTTSTTTSTTSSTTTTLPACVDTTPPSVVITAPAGGPLPGLSTLIVADADDPGGSGIAEVQFYYQETGSSPPVLIAKDAAPLYSALWTFPSCATAPNNTFKIFARAVDRCGNTRDSGRVNLNLNGRGCFQASAESVSPLALGSELDVPGGRGQVVLNGNEAFFPSRGRAEIMASGRADVYRVEALLVEGRGPGTWRFHLDPAGVRPGSLRVVAGDVSLATPDAIAFRLKGRPGERVVFTFALVPAR